MLIVEILSADSEAETDSAVEPGKAKEEAAEESESALLEERSGSHASAGPGN